MDNQSLNNIIEKTRMKIAIANLEEEKKIMKNKGTFKMVASFVLIFMIASGIVVATNYKKIAKVFGLGAGIDRAVENGYIAEPNQEYQDSNTEIADEERGIVADNVKVKAKLKDFLMDDLNLSTHFDFEFDKQINKFMPVEKIRRIELKDLIVTDEEKRIIYCLDKKTFDKYCKDNNLPYVFTEFNENYMNNGLNSFIAEKDAEGNSITHTYNMYTPDKYPNSKKLNFKFNTMILLEETNNPEDSKEVLVKGNWEIKVDVPEKMYNRKSMTYRVVSCSEENFNIYAAKVSDTGFEIGLTVSNIVEPERPKDIYDKMDELHAQEQAGKISEEESNKRINKLFHSPENLEYVRLRSPFDAFDWLEPDPTFEQYVENEKGKQFNCTGSPSRKQNANFIDGNKFDYYETFGLTTYDATDKLTVRLTYYQKPVIIELEKVK